MFDVGGKLLNNTRSMCVDSLFITRVCHVPLAFHCVHGCSNERNEIGDVKKVRFSEER